MIQRLQLRGITRAPSDRMTSDGGCAESLNVQTELQELAPAPQPRDVTASNGLPTDKRFDILHLHKTKQYGHYICMVEMPHYVGVEPEHEGSEQWVRESSVTELHKMNAGKYRATFLWGNMPNETRLMWVDQTTGSGFYVIVINSTLRHLGANTWTAECTYGGPIEVAEDGVENHAIGTWQMDEDTHEYKFVPFLSLPLTESVKDVISIGNTIGVVTASGIQWFIFKEGEYKSIGTAVPFPSFHFLNKEVEGVSVTDPSSYTGTDPIRQMVLEESRNDDYGLLSMIGFDDLADSYNNDRDVVNQQEPLPMQGGTSLPFDSIRILNKITDAITLALAKNRELGVYNNQLMAVLVLRLYDDTKIMSTPVVLAPGFEFPYKIEYSAKGEAISGQVSTSYKSEIVTTITMKAAYKLFFQLEEISTFLDDWTDIVTGIEVYVSQRAIYDHYPKLRANAIGLEESKESMLYTANATLQFESSKTSYEDEYLSLANFYLLKSFDITPSTLAQLSAGVVIDNIPAMDEAYLVQQERLDITSDMTHYPVSYTRAATYNNKVIASGLSQDVKFHVPAFTAVHYYNEADLDYSIKPELAQTMGSAPADYVKQIFRANFHIKDIDGNDSSILCTFPLRPDSEAGKYLRYGANMAEAGETYLANVFSFLICPDTRAYKVDISYDYVSNNNQTHLGIGTFEMKPHPYLPCSYMYLEHGMERNITQLIPIDTTSEFVEGIPALTESMPNRLYVSAMENPFVFPMASRYTFSAEVIATAVAATALSTGQFGQFPLYVFTKDGIWAMESNAIGDFVSQKPVNRQVAISPEAITSIDHSVVYITNEGVMAINGSEVSNLSRNMNGRIWQMPKSAIEPFITGTPWEKYLNVILDPTLFRYLITDTKGIAYDAVGKRLIFFFKHRTDIQYVYMIESGTWHKLCPDSVITGLVNSYPECLVTSTKTLPDDSTVTTLLDMAQPITEAESTGYTYAVIASRAFDLELPDVLKSIKHLRIRASRSTGSTIQYILLGSQDGETYVHLSSLRGKSWKMYRIIIFAKLKANDRISYVDIDFDSRFTDRIR